MNLDSFGTMDREKTDLDVGGSNCSEIQKISLQELLDNFGSNEFINDLTVLQKYTDALMGDDENIMEFKELIYSEVLNKCMQWLNDYIFNLSPDKVADHIKFRKFLFLITEKKLNVSEDNLEIQDLRLSIINSGSLLIKMCIENGRSVEIEYYIGRIEQELDLLIEFCKENSLPNTTILSKKTELILYRIEKMVTDDKIEMALEELNRQKENVLQSKKFRDYYVGLCYNASLKFSTLKMYDYTLTGLLLAFDVCKISETVSEIMKTGLHLLVCICLKYDPEKNWQNAMNALDLAYNNNEILDMFYIVSKIKFAFFSEQEQFLEEVLERAAEWEQIEMKNVKQIIELLRKNGQSLYAADFARRIRCNLSSSEDKFSLMKLEVQLYIPENDRRVFSLVESCIEMIKTKEVPEDAITDLYKLLLSYSASQFREKNYRDSLNWYTYCARICKAGNLDISFLRQAQSRICLCHLEMNEFERAKEVFDLQLKTSGETSNPLYIYLALQIAFIKGDEKLVDETLSTCNKNQSDDKLRDVLLSCCHKALVSDKKNDLLKILDAALLEYNTLDGTILSAKLAQCLIGLCVKFTEDENIQKKCLLYMDKALQILQQNVEHIETPELSQWFSRASWNMALTPDIQPKFMFELFLRCCCFSDISTKNVNRLKNSLMMAAASGLCIVRQMNGPEEQSDKKAYLGKVMTVIDKCKSLETGTNVTLLRLLYLYEFEARCHLDEWNDGMASIKDILHLHFMDVKTLEHIAAIVNEFSPRNYQLIVESMKSAVEKISDIQDKGCDEASKTYHCLIQFLFYVQEYLSSSFEEENLIYCNNLLKLVEENTESYPQLEILWIMSKCWNWGIRKLTLNDVQKAYKWCTLAMAFLQKLQSMKTLHEEKLNAMYSTYFSDFLK